MPVNDVKQFVSAVKAAPDKYSYGSFGAGTTSQFAGEMFFHAAGLKIQHVPYEGSAPAMVDLIGGQIPFTVDTVSAALPQLKEGKVKAIAVTSKKRTAIAPDVPTAAESGYPGLVHASWYGVWAPKGLAPARQQALNKAFNAAVTELAKANALAPLGIEPVTESVEQFSKYVAEDVAKSADLLKTSGYSPQ